MIKISQMMHITIQKMRNTYRHDGCSGGEEKSTPRARRESELERRSSNEREREVGLLQGLGDRPVWGRVWVSGYTGGTL